jgi:hypothetical protein
MGICAVSVDNDTFESAHVLWTGVNNFRIRCSDGALGQYGYRRALNARRHHEISGLVVRHYQVQC